MSSSPELSLRPARWPWVAFAGFLVVATASMVLVELNGESLAEQIPYVIAFSMFGAVGALIVSRDRRNTIGLLLMWSSFFTALSFLSGEWFTYAVTHGTEGWLVVVCGFLNSAGWMFGILLMVFLLPLLFPDGRLPSRRWRPLLWFIAAFIVILAMNLAFGQEVLTGSADVGVKNPFYVDAIGGFPNLDPVIGILFPAIFGASIVSLVLRFRRSSGLERQQIKWVVFGLVAALLAITSTSFSSQDTLLSSVIGGVAFLMFPLSIGIAVLRFHLYDLDVVIKKTVIFATVVVAVTAFYLMVAIALPTIVLGRGSGSGVDAWQVLIGLAIGLLIFPIRSRAGRFANRLVYGKRATPYEVLSEFSERVGEAYADEDVLPRMARILGEGVGADRADVWLAVDRELRDVAAWPPDAGGASAIPLANGAMPSIEGADRVYPVEQGGELLGALAVRKSASDPVSAADEKLIAGLASQAGLVLRNVRLTEELKARLEDLKAAQRRLVSAQDEERRKLERNIHDGAQQQLVALSVKLRLADGLVERDATQAHELLAQLQGETNSALEDLRDLARGIYPPLLADKGLAAALAAQGRKSGLPVQIEADGIGRYPQEVEAAVYFSCLEALQNVAKYADASSVTVSLAERDRVLTFIVADDGRGFDPVSSVGGSGLQGMADRLGAQDGELVVTSSPGRGTTIEGRLRLSDAEVPA